MAVSLNFASNVTRFFTNGGFYFLYFRPVHTDFALLIYLPRLKRFSSPSQWSFIVVDRDPASRSIGVAVCPKTAFQHQIVKFHHGLLRKNEFGWQNILLRSREIPMGHFSGDEASVFQSTAEGGRDLHLDETS